MQSSADQLLQAISPEKSSGDLFASLEGNMIESIQAHLRHQLGGRWQRIGWSAWVLHIICPLVTSFHNKMTSAWHLEP